MSFPPATEMFQFAGFASCAYGFSAGYRLRGGLPHSEIPGSTIARISPGLFAACHVLHRLSVPRHPPDALDSRLSATPNGKNHGCDKLSSQKTLRAGSHMQPLGPRTVSRLRSHNSLLHNCPSTSATGGQVTLRRRDRSAAALPCNSLRPRLLAWWRCLVEVNGIEPMTSCLQSRRSPN